MKLTVKKDVNRDAGSFDDSQAVKERALKGGRMKGANGPRIGVLMLHQKDAAESLFRE